MHKMPHLCQIHHWWISTISYSMGLKHENGHVISTDRKVHIWWNVGTLVLDGGQDTSISRSGGNKFGLSVMAWCVHWGTCWVDNEWTDCNSNIWLEWNSLAMGWGQQMTYPIGKQWPRDWVGGLGQYCATCIGTICSSMSWQCKYPLKCE